MFLITVYEYLIQTARTMIITIEVHYNLSCFTLMGCKIESFVEDGCSLEQITGKCSGWQVY